MSEALVLIGECLLSGTALADAARAAGASLDTSSVSSVPPAREFPLVVRVFGPHSTASADTVASCVKCAARGAFIVLLEPSTVANEGQLRQLAVRAGAIKAIQQTVQLGDASYSLVRATRPSFDTGAQAPISLSKAAAPSKPVWKIGADEDDDLIDEDALLTEEDRKPAAKPAGCPPTKKACANCSCGRAEAEAAGVTVQLTQEMLDNPQSACGSCGMGDAFRCATCPYRGLPSFQPGKKIELSSDFLVADA